MEEKNTHNFSKYGIYTITDSMDLYFPGTEIKIEKIANNVFSYSKKDFENNLIEKKIPMNSSELQIEVCPIHAVNYPAKRSNYFFLEFETPVFLPEESSASIFVQCPIEIGVFLIHETHKDSLDWFTCDPVNSRFGLYGTPDSGTLCKYSKTPIVGSYEGSLDYFNGVIRINLDNQLTGGHSVTKVIFPVVETNIYYKDSKAIFDTITATLKKKLTLELLDVDPVKIETDWTKSTPYEKVDLIKRMDLGID